LGKIGMIGLTDTACARICQVCQTVLGFVSSE
jgi:hypothetical protein